MPALLQVFVWIPLTGFLITMLIPRKKEKAISLWVITIMAIQLVAITAFGTYWLLNSLPVQNHKHLVFFKKEDIEIFLDFYFDITTWVFALMGAGIALLVTIFSRFYLHREEGFKRFFTTLMLFFLGYNVIVFGGNFETLFIGWEIIGICSFLLIAFYRDRYLPVKNALKTISVYRLGDVCLILAMWMSHHLWHENIMFVTLNDAALVQSHLIEHNWYGFFIAFMIFIAAAVKSAQFPFSSWLPRAMEGPTSSSAVFYGSLSVHVGVYLLIRTYPYWETMLGIKVLIIVVGVITSFVAAGIASVQSTVKTQIAYASISQIGIIFIEVAMGWHILALIHFAGHSMLRTYQLLVSPSVLSYRIHNMLFQFNPAKKVQKNASSLQKAIYLLNVKEWNLDFILNKYGWQPFKWIGRKLGFLSTQVSIVLLSCLYIGGLLVNEFRENFSADVLELLPFVYSFFGLMLVLHAFADRKDAIHAWLMAIAGQFFMTLSVVLLNEDFGYHHILLFLSGSFTSAIGGYICLRKIRKIDNDIQLNRFHGYVYEKPTIAFIFLICCLGVVGLPFTPTFIGIDLLFSHIHKHQEMLIIFTTISFLFIEIAVLRIYARVFLGQHKKNDHPIAFRSS